MLLSIAEVKHSKIDSEHHYEDSITIGLFNATSQVVNTSLESILEELGRFFLDYAFETGWEESLRALASDLEGFLCSIDRLHYFVHKVIFKANVKGPSFRCEVNYDGSLILHYYSKHLGLYPMVKGIVEAVATRMYNQGIRMTLKSQTLEVMGCNDEPRNHVVFLINLPDPSDNSNLSICSRSMMSLRSEFEYPLRLSLLNTARLLPHHVCFDHNLVIHQFGFHLKKTLPHIKKGQTKLTHIFEIVHPNIPMNFDNIVAFINGVFVFRMKLGVGPASYERPTDIKGQMILLEDPRYLMYVCSPNVASVKDLLNRGLFFNEIPVHDATRNVILLNQSRISQSTIQCKLETAKAAVKKATNDLDSEREKNEILLKELLPASVAKSLQEGNTVAPAEFAEATVLFSDVVSFTVICSNCTPYDVVDFLNTMFTQFDKLTTVNNVFKVETIGDAYVVVGGVPEIDEEHATNMCNMALGMMWITKSVKSPVESHKIQIRVGIHSGSVVAGVVGQKMPRYCLFGDTIIVAQNIESTGVASKIAVSSDTYRLASKSNALLFNKRGWIRMSDNRSVFTYFLIKNQIKSIWDLVQQNRGESQSTDGNKEFSADSSQNYRNVRPKSIGLNSVLWLFGKKMNIQRADVSSSKMCSIS